MSAEHHRVVVITGTVKFVTAFLTSSEDSTDVVRSIQSSSEVSRKKSSLWAASTGWPVATCAAGVVRVQARARAPCGRAGRSGRTGGVQ